jgi:hypothetical protein
VSDTIEQQDAAPAPVAPRGGNGFAVTSLITGIIGIWPLGLIFGFLGLRRAKKVAKGKVMSWIGIVLSVIYLGVTVWIYPHVTKLLDPGCQSAITVQNDYPDSKVNKDASTNPAAFGADLQAEAKGLTDAANKSKISKASSTMRAEVADLGAMLASLQAGQAPSSTVVAKANADQDAITKACGGF